MFRIFILIIASSLVFAQKWVHYSAQSDVRSAVKMADGTVWAAMAWGLSEIAANGHATFHTPGNKGLEAADFVQLFALPGGDVMAISRNGVLVRKSKNSSKFEAVNTSFAEKKRDLEPDKGKIADNILILPFNGALAFYDYSLNRSAITLLQIGTSSLVEHKIKNIVVKNDSIWVDLDSLVWKRRINWKEIHRDNFLFDPMSWIESKDKKMPPSEDNKISAEVGYLNDFHLERVKTIALNGNNAVAWGNNTDLFARMQSDEWGWSFRSNPSGYGDDQRSYLTKSLAMQPNGNFAAGMWGAGVLLFNNNFPKAELAHWLHASNTDKCPTEWSGAPDEWTIVQGMASTPDYSGYIFSYESKGSYGIGFVNHNGQYACLKSDSASARAATTVFAKENEIGEWEIYVSWRFSLDSDQGGVDLYKIPNPRVLATNPKSFNPALVKKWEISFGTPIDFGFDNRGVLWAASISGVFYLDEKKDEWKEPYIRGFNSGPISAFKMDAQGGLWVGTLGNGAFALSQKNNSPDTLNLKRLGVKDGLLSELIYDIAIDTIRGRVYFANDLGLSVYYTPDVRNSQNYMQSGSPKTIAYPNPFRPGEHSTLTISNISEKSSVYILDSFGKRIKVFKGGDIRGGSVRWDGKNESGRLVAPGLYHYIAAEGKNTRHGKILIER